MSREIKFRAWLPSSEIMIDFWEWGGEADMKWEHHGKAIVQQYTGLKDKNGKEIYEGDIVLFQRQHWHDGEWENERAKKRIVEWLDRPAAFRLAEKIGKEWESNELDFSDINISSSRVIGNIYENPELL